LFIGKTDFQNSDRVLKPVRVSINSGKVYKLEIANCDIKMGRPQKSSFCFLQANFKNIVETACEQLTGKTGNAQFKCPIFKKTNFLSAINI